jgi:hypothetical protein
MVYLALGAAFVVLGIGAWKLRRWARPLILTLGWSGAIAMGMGALLSIFVMPRLLQDTAAAGTPGLTGCLVGMMIGIFSIFLAFPIALVVFFSRPRTRELFERDPRRYWTDGTHPILLGIAVLMWVGALGSLAGLFYPALPLFGVMLTGWPLRLTMIFFAGACAWIGWAVYRRQPAGFWALVLLQALSLFNVWTMRNTDSAAMLRAMGYSETEISQAAQMDIFRDPVVLGAMAVSWLLLTVALFAIRKHFVPADASGTHPPPPV